MVEETTSKQREEKGKLKNLIIITRLIISYLFIVALMVITSIVAIIMLGNVSGAMQTFYEHEYLSVKNSIELQRDLTGVRSATVGAMVDAILGDSEKAASQAAAAEESFASAEGNVDALAECYTDKSAINTAKQSLSTVKPIFTQALTLARSGDGMAMREMYLGQVLPLLKDLGNQCDTICDTAAETAEQEVAVAKREQPRRASSL